MSARKLRCVILAALLMLGVCWTVASAAEQDGARYPNDQYLLTAKQLQATLGREQVIIVDARDDESFDGKLVPGALRMPWTLFTRADPARNMAGVFVGTAEAREILGRHGITRADTVVLYDSVAWDGGATASYIFWVLDLLGHERMALLERGIDGWADAGLPLAREPAKPEPQLYQAPRSEIRLRRLADESLVVSCLDDPSCQILDVRSRAEYLGTKITTAPDGTPLKPGHIPGALNVDYRLNWSDPETKAIKPYAELRGLYRGLDPRKAVITYCHSGRRSSFSYFILRLMGFEDVILYDDSWMGWGRPGADLPVETAETAPPPDDLPGASSRAPASSAKHDAAGDAQAATADVPPLPRD